MADVLAVCRPIEAADVAVVTADVRDVYTDYTRPMCRVDHRRRLQAIDVVDVADVLAVYRSIDAADVAVLAADVRDVYTDYTRPMCRVDVVDVYVVDVYRP